jgi:hypothetical protein
MKLESIYIGLSKGMLSPEKLAVMARKESAVIQVLINGMKMPGAKIKYGCAKALRILVKDSPAMLYPHFDTFSDQLNSSNKIMKWEAIYLIAGLSGVDTRNKFDKIWDFYFAGIEGPVMITAANLIKGGTTIALKRPEIADDIVVEILRVQNGHYESAECYEIVCGQALKAFSKLIGWVDDPHPMFEFAGEHQGSTRPSTRRAAEKLLKRQRLAVYALTL